MKLSIHVFTLTAVLVLTCGLSIADAWAQTVTAVPQPVSVPTVTVPELDDSLAARQQRLVEHRGDAKAIPVPEWNGLIRPGPLDESVQIHNTRTGETSTRQWSELSGAMSAWVPGNAGVDGRPIEQEGSALDNFSELYRINNPSEYPWRVCVKLFMTLNGGWWMGSGMLIDPKHVMTAGHCIYNRDSSAWVEYVDVIPGYELWNEPYGSPRSANLMTWAGFINDGLPEYDMGIIELDRPVGAVTGWHGYGYNNDDNWFYEQTWNAPSYPGFPCSPDSGHSMYNWYGTVDVVYPYVMRVNRLGCGGMSGSCAYTFLSGNRVVFADGCQQNEDGGYHLQCRISESKYITITNFISENTPAVLDLVSMDCEAAPSTIQAGLPLTSFGHLIHNYSTASWTGTVTANVYLSTNNIISTGDDLIGSGGISFAWGPLSTAIIDWQDPPTIPVSTAHGDYFLGVIIDHADYNNFNNASSYDDAFPIHIDVCPAISMVQLSSPAAGDSVCSGWDWTYRWRHAVNAMTYRIQWDNEPTFQFPQQAMTADTSILHTMTGTGLRYWRVRGESDCRSGSWSTVRTLRLLGAPDAPVLHSPANRAHTCSGAPASFCWNAADDAASYLVQWDDVSGFTSPESATTSDTCISRTLSGTGLRYWRVRGQNDCSIGSWSTVRNVVLDSLDTPTVTIWQHATYLDLYWTSENCATSYRVEYSPALGSPFTDLATTGDPWFRLTNPGLIGFYRVIAIQ